MCRGGGGGGGERERGGGGGGVTQRPRPVVPRVCNPCNLIVSNVAVRGRQGQQAGTIRPDPLTGNSPNAFWGITLTCVGYRGLTHELLGKSDYYDLM